MRVSTVALANLRRRRSKAIFLSAAIAIGIGTVVALLGLSSSIREEIGIQLDRYGANIVIVPQSNTLALDYGGVPVQGVAFDVRELNEGDLRKISTIPYRNRLAVIAPKLLGVATVGDQRVTIAGVDFKQEMRLRRWWNLHGSQPGSDDDLIVGFEAARVLGVTEVHGEVEQAGGHHQGPSVPHFVQKKSELNIGTHALNVSAILLPTGGPEDRMIFGSLPRVQQVLRQPGKLSLVEVSALCKDCPVDDIVGQIRKVLPNAKVSAIQQAVKARNEMVERLTRFSIAVAAIVLVIGALVIFTTVMGSVIERTREIGVLRAVGFRRKHIIGGLLLEVLIVSLVGGAVGWTFGVAASWAALPYFTEGDVKASVHPSLLVLAVFAAVLIATAGSLYPAWRASRLDPAEAVRSV